MANILNSVLLNRQIQRIVETKNGMIINGQYYSKSKMTPVPFTTFPTYGSVYDLSMNQKMILKQTVPQRGRTVGDTIISDINNPNIQFIFTNSIKGENIQTILKVSESNGKCELINYKLLSAIPTTNGMVCQIAGQDDNYLYIIFYTNTFRSYLCKLDKQSLEVISIETTGDYSFPFAIYEDHEYIYFMNKMSLNQNAAKRYNKASGLFELKTITNDSSNIHFSTRFSDPIWIDETNFYTYSISHSTADAKMKIRRYDFNLNAETYDKMIAESITEIVWDQGITRLPIFASNGFVHYDPFIVEINDKKYLNIAVYETSNSATVANYPKYGLYVFEIDETKNLSFRNFLNFGNIPIRGFVGINGNKTIVVASDQSLFFTEFSESDKKFILNSTINSNPQHVGVDLEENIWVVNGAGEVEILNPTSVRSVLMEFEKSSYSYDGNDISTFIEVIAKNINNENIESKLKLTIKGEAVWTSNNTKVINITTSTTAKVSIPITIKNKGNINILPEIIL